MRQRGNITSLTRDGFGTNTYGSYTGNRLNSISGFTTSSYTYDVNGNLKTDAQKGITNISYNHLNLPQTITAPVMLAYSYDATGAKLRKVSTTGTTTTTDYVDGIQYTNGVIDFIQTEEGIALNSGGSYSYRYNLSDHLGNVRATFKVNGSAIEVLQRDDYYAFGLRKSALNDIGAVSLQNKYLYNGKELQEELEQYDYGARLYDPVIGRWNVVDPLAEDYDDVSTYNYGLNNPIFYIDPDGKSTEGFYNDYIFDKDGKLKDVKENKLPDRFYQERASGDVDQIYKLTVDMAGQYLAESVKYLKNGGTLGEVEIKGKKFQVGYYTPLLTRPYPMNPGIKSVFTYERFLPGTRALVQAIEITNFMLDLSLEIRLSKGGRQNVWPDQYGYPPNVKDVDWGKSDSQLADEKSKEHGDNKRGPKSPNNIAKKWYRDKRPNKN